MAEVITRLRVESSEYDNKIKRAQEGLLHMESACRKVGGTLAVLEKDEKAFVESLGSMETVSKTARGRLSELTTAFTELSMQYKRLTDEEKNGDFGRALSGSLELLRTRIADTRGQLADTNRELNGTPGILDQLTSRLTVNVDAMKLFNMGLQAAGMALDVVKDAFFQSESNIDEWGRTVKGAEGAYDVFLDTLNNGNWSSFFDNLDTAIKGGRDLYDTLDRLGSVKSNNQAAIAIVQARIQQLRVLQQQGKDVTAEIEKATQELKSLQGEGVNAGRAAGRKTILNTLQNEVNSNNTTGTQVSESQLRLATNRLLKEGQSYFDEMAAIVRMYEGDVNNQSLSATRIGSPTTGFNTTAASPVFDLSKLKPLEQEQYLIAKAITEGETRIQEGIGIFAQAVAEAGQSAREEFRGNRYAAQGSGGGGRSGSGNGTGKTREESEESQNQKKITDLTREYQRLADVSKSATGEELVATDERMTAITKEIEALQKRNAVLKEYADIAQGKMVPQSAIDPTNLPAAAPTDYQIVKSSAMEDPGDKVVTGLSLKGIGEMTSQLQTAVQNIDIGSPILANLQRSLADSTTLGTLMKTALENGLDMSGLDFSGLKEQIAHGLDIPDEVFQELQAKINDMLASMGIEPIELDFRAGGDVAKNAKETKAAWSAAASAISSAGSALQNMENPAAKVAGIVMQAVANIALGFAQATASPATGAAGVFGWIAAVTAGLATMTATIASIKSATKGGFAQGGIVPGNSYSGDNLRTSDYGINSGELVLTKAQQGNLAGQLSERENGNMGNVMTSISAEQIRVVLRNGASRRGRTVAEWLG